MNKIILGGFTPSLILQNNIVTTITADTEITTDADVKIKKEFLNAPWIATRYFSPYILTNTDIIVPFYVTDHAQSEYLSNNNDKQFNIIVEFNGNTINKIVNAGENEINIGSTSLEGEMYFSLKCIDLSNNVESAIQFIDIYVKSSFDISDSETYYMTSDDLSKYNIDNTNNTTESVMVNNIDGINNMISDVKNSGYKKLVMYNPNGDTDERSVYRIQPYNTRTRAIMVPSYFTLDLNNSKIKQHVSYSNVDYGYGKSNSSLIIRTVNEAVDSHLINGIIEGDWDEHDTTIDSGNTFEGEGYNATHFGGKFCSMENIEVCWITGYSVCSNNNTGTCKHLTNEIGTDWTQIFIDKNGRENICNECISSSYIDCTSSKYNYVSANNYLGYAGLNGAYLEYIHFYDENKVFIKSYKVRQYGLVRRPENAVYCRVTLYSKTIANNCKIELSNQKPLTQCQFKNLYIHDTRTCGMATGMYNRLLVENCIFERSAYRVTPVTIDIEDGYQYAENYYFKNNRITEWASTQTGGFICTCGHNMVFEGDLSGFTFSIGKVKGLDFHKVSSDIASFKFLLQDRDITGFSLLNDITFKDDVETGVKVENHEIIYKNCKFLKSINRLAEAGWTYADCCILDNCEFDLTNAQEFTTCKVKNSTIDISPFKRGFKCVYFENCTIISSNTNSKRFAINDGPINIVGCTIKNVDIDVTINTKVTIKNCILENVTFNGPYKDNIIQENNNII